MVGVWTLTFDLSEFYCCHHPVEKTLWRFPNTSKSRFLHFSNENGNSYHHISPVRGREEARIKHLAQRKPPVSVHSCSFPESSSYLSVSLPADLTCFPRGWQWSPSGMWLSSKMSHRACTQLDPHHPSPSLGPPTHVRKVHTPILTPAWPLPLFLGFPLPEGFAHFYGGQVTSAVEDKGALGFQQWLLALVAS